MCVSQSMFYQEPVPTLFMFLCVSSSFQKFKEYLNGSNLITKLQAKHDLLKQTLGEGKSSASLNKKTACLFTTGL